MRLRTLRLHGFKSFADRTQLEFRDGITAIVGSNGCGKSNIADAIRWVLGEQRASAVRGAKMDEVIFQGTTRRRALNFAEVALLFSNEQGRVAVPQSEIEIARRTFREGGSEYSMNRTACRLRDIHNLLRDTGLGSNAYSVIESGMIETLLSDRAEERRSLFEEAAGIGRYKDSRQATTRRLESAEADLARLGDLVAEVESKVRSLARQRRRAQRLQELRARRLDLEVAAAKAELENLEQALRDATARTSELESEVDAARRARTEAEALVSRRRAEHAELTQRRVPLAARLDELRNRLHARERESVVADERRSNAELRIVQLTRERTEQDGRRSALAAESERLAEQLTGSSASLDAARERLEACSEGSAELRAVLVAERQRAAAAAERVRQSTQLRAATEGEQEALDARRREAEEQVQRLRAQAAQLETEAAELGAQTDLWAGRSAELRDRLEAAETAAEFAREETVVLRGRENTAREALRAADDRLSRLTAQVEAREALERSYEGFSPAVAALRAEPQRFPGVLGPLADFVDTTGAAPGAAAAVEAFLGPLLHALVVDDLAVARRVREWFRSEWSGGGSLLLLPLDAPSLLGIAPGPASGLRGRGAGKRWVESLLADVVVAGDDDPLGGFRPDRNLVTPDGDSVDGRGLIRLGERSRGEGILVRRKTLAALRAERDAAAAERDRAHVELGAVRDALADAEYRAREADDLKRGHAGELQRIEGETTAHARRRERLQREQAELVRLLERQESVRNDAAVRAVAAAERLTGLDSTLADAELEAAAARGRLATLEEQWESVRDEETEFRVAVARAESDLRETERRLLATRQGAEAAARRVATIDAEAAELHRTLDAVAAVRQRAGEEIEQLFAARDFETAALRKVDERLAEAEREAAAADARARQTRGREDAGGEERHRLELSIAEARSRTERLRERLEAEWGQPWDALLAAANPPEDGDAGAWQTELHEIAGQIDAIGPVNLLAIQEHDEEARRLEFLLSQQKDLVAARDDLVAAIRQINRTAREVFTTTFAAIRENFQRTFHSLFQGGQCDVWLSAEGDPLESPVEIQASPVGKKTQRIHLLSGGERTLTALALLFAIYLVKPSPFCLLDEVDAPLDESNVGRFLQLLQDFKAETQFVVITHNTRTMEAADWVYGVTMEEPGVSSIVGVELEGTWAREGRVA